MGSSRSGINKLSKKEVNGVNIVKACKDISQPPEPFALRFSSNLMMGVARVYGQQYNFYCSDVNSMWMRLKRDMALMESESVDMVHPEAKIDTITFDYDLAIEHDILRPLKIIQSFELEVARGSRSKELAVEFGWATQSTIDLRDSLSDNSLSPTRKYRSVDRILTVGTFNEQRRRITLDERSIAEVAKSGFGFDGDIGFDLPDDALVGEDLGLYIDSEGNLVEYAPTLGVEDTGAGSVVPQIPVTFESFGKQKRDGKDGGYLLVAGGEFIQTEDDLYLPCNQEQGIDINMQLAEIAPQGRPRIGERHSKTSKLIIDDHTMLPRENILESRENFQLYQAALIRDHQFKQAAASARARIEGLMSRPLCISGYSLDLATFWSSASVRTINTAVADQSRIGAMQAGQIADGPLLFDMEQDADMFFEPPEPEVRRRQMSADTAATPIDLGGGVFGPGSIDSSKHSSHMPWSIDMRASVSARSEHSFAGSDHLRQDFETTFNQALGRPVQSPLEFADLNDEPLIRRRHHKQRGHTGSRSGSRDSSRDSSQPWVSIRDGGQSPLVAAYDPFLGEQEDAAVDLHAISATQERIVVERETVNFMRYVRSILREANASSFSFEDVVSVHQRRDVAASAFYHILSLSTMGKMRPAQAAPYQDIHVELIE
ncbi:hypothetical protein BGX27_009892 [Mortierella sp. AM989]|nr:hypothetical protein BGX27_009892 [Mortierella sp. AM989]